MSRQLDPTAALVILSGGQDSTTALFWAKRQFQTIHAVTFNYGQRHVIEIEAAKKVAELARIKSHEVIAIPDVLVGTSPLVNHNKEVEKYASANDLPTGLEKTFVPSRNLLFLTIASNRAYALRCQSIVIGVSQEDHEGYPDCRRDFLDAARMTLRTGLAADFYINAPLLYENKAGTVKLAHGIGGEAWEALAYTHTCYNGNVPPCGKCHACLLREKGFKEAGLGDPLIGRLINEA